MDHQLEVSKERLEILQILDSYEGEIVSVSKLAERRDSGKEATRRLVKRMDDDGLVNYESSYSGSKISLTTTGLRKARDTPTPSGNVGADVGGSDLKRLHGFVVEARILSDTPDDWVGVMQEKEEVSILNDSEGQTTMAKDIWCIRLHKDNLTLQLREGCSISSNDSAECFRKAHSQAQDVGGWLEGAADVRIQLQRFRITNAELGFEGHPLAELAGELPEVPLDRFSVMDEDLQKEVLGIDASLGTEELEPKSERTEAIAQTIEREMSQIAERPEAVEKRHNLENELMVQDVSAQETVHAVRQMHSTADEVLEISEKVEDMKQVLKEEKKTRDALIELVRSNQNVIHELNDEVLQEESSDLVEDTIRDVLDDDGFSSPGLQYGHLMAWDVEEQECRKILDKSVVGKSDSDLLELVDQWKP